MRALRVIITSSRLNSSPCQKSVVMIGTAIMARASADGLRIKVTGEQGHAGFPWRAIDPITTASQIVLGLQTIVSRRTDLMKSPAVVSISTINGGSNGNIVADSVVMTGTMVRTG